MKVAVLASTNGTDFQALIDERDAGKLPGTEITCLITNTFYCGAAFKAKEADIPVHFIDPFGKSREEFDREVMEALEHHHVDLVVLIGYMRIIGKEMVKKYRGRILNVHPSLLPKFGGGMDSDVHQAVLDAGEKKTGMTIHFVTEDLDAGPIVCQKSVPVAPDDTVDTLKQKVQALEKEWYPKVIRAFAKGKTHVD